MPLMTSMAIQPADKIQGIKFLNFVCDSNCKRTIEATTTTYVIRETSMLWSPKPLVAYPMAFAIYRAKIWKGSAIRVPHKKSITTEIIPARSSLLILNHDALTRAIYISKTNNLKL